MGDGLRRMPSLTVCDPKIMPMKTISGSCPVCKELLSYLPHTDDPEIICRRCGKFQVDDHVARDLEGWKDQHLRKLSAYIRTSSAGYVKLTKGNAKKIRSAFPNYSVEEKQSLLLELLRDNGDGVGQSVAVEPELDWPAIWARDGEEMIFHMKAMDGRKLIEIEQRLKGSSGGDIYYCCVTTKGWRELQRTVPGADNALKIDTKRQRRRHRGLPPLVQWIVAIMAVLGVLVGIAMAIYRLAE